MEPRSNSEHMRGYTAQQSQGVVSGSFDIESGGPLALKWVLELVMDVDDTALSYLTQNLQSLRISGVPGENVGTIVSYLKGTLLLLSNCNSMPTDIMGLLNDTFCLAACDEFTDYMKAIYFSHCCRTQSITPMELLTLAECKYCTLYCGGKWEKLKEDPDSAFL